MAEYLSITDLIVETEKRLSEVPGTSVQQYAEDNIAAFLIEGYKFVARKRWWGHLMQWFTITLDGTVGIPNADIVGVTSFKDVRAIWPSDRNRPLSSLPSSVNPFLITGNRPQFVEEYTGAPANRLFRIWPNAAVGNVYMHGRLLADDFTDQDQLLNFDPAILSNYAAWKMMADEGTNPGAIADLEQRFSMLLGQANILANEQPIILDTASPVDPVDVWFVNP